MGSLGGEVARKKAMWLHPKVIGASPSERWGHSACYSNGLVYIFGGCCGGMHFCDILVLNLETMAWNILVTRGQEPGPGPRDSHSAVLVGHKMLVFGGTNGSEKVNDTHILDLQSKEWTHPECKGNLPSPRESHTATLVGDEKLVIFGGSGEGEGNYLNDMHVLDLKNMRWASPQVRGNIPVPRDSHSAVAIGNKLFLYGGDSGDRYQGDVDVLDLDTFAWSRLDVQGPSPGARAGHVSVTFGTKVHVIGGVGDKQYYNDVWVLDVVTCSWTKLDICGLKPQGRFSHTAVVTNLDVIIYGGCGEDEHPLNELLILRLGVEQTNGLYNMPVHRIIRNLSNQESKRFLRADNLKTLFVGINENLEAKEAQEQRILSKQSFQSCTDTFHLKRRRTNNPKAHSIESEAGEHSLSLSQHSSPSRSDQEQTPCKKTVDSIRAPQEFPLFKQQTSTPSSIQSNNVPLNQMNHKSTVSTTRDLHVYGERPSQSNAQIIHAGNIQRHDAHFMPEEHRSLEAGQFQNLVGAEVRGRVDGAFDSGYLMTAIVNGRTFRGVLFAPGPNLLPRGVNHCQRPSSTLTNHTAPTHIKAPINHSSLGGSRQYQTPAKLHAPQFLAAECRGSMSVSRSSTSLDTDTKHKSELKGVFLTLGGPGNGNADHS